MAMSIQGSLALCLGDCHRKLTVDHQRRSRAAIAGEYRVGFGMSQRLSRNVRGTGSNISSAIRAVGFITLLAFSLSACHGRGVAPVNEPSAGQSAESGAAYFKAKCKSQIEDCLADAQSQCGGEFTVIHRESHAGGLLADALPGPVPWYTVTFRCGMTAEATAESAQNDALRAFVMPQCSAEWEGRCGFLTDKLEFGATLDAPPLAIESATPKKGGGLLRAAAKACNEQADTITQECRDAFRRSYVRLLSKRYPNVKDVRLTSWCENHTAECDPSRPDLLRVLEQDYLATHDRTVFAAYKANLKAATSKSYRDAAQSEDQRHRAGEEERIRQTTAQMIQRAIENMNTQQATVHVNVTTQP